MNRVVLMGRLTKDPEIQALQNEKHTLMARYTLAVNRYPEGADFISCVAFGKNAEFAEKWMHKGQQFLIEGRIQTGSYKNKDGNTVYTTDVIIEHQEFTERATDASNTDNNNNKEKESESKNNNANKTQLNTGSQRTLDDFMDVGDDPEGLPFC